MTSTSDNPPTTSSTSSSDVLQTLNREKELRRHYHRIATELGLAMKGWTHNYVPFTDETTDFLAELYAPEDDDDL